MDTTTARKLLSAALGLALLASAATGPGAFTGSAGAGMGLSGLRLDLSLGTRGPRTR